MDGSVVKYTETIKPTKQFVSAGDLAAKSYQLADMIHKSGQKPAWIVSLFRGGVPIGMYVQEYLQRRGHKLQHYPIIASSYVGNTQNAIAVSGIKQLVAKILHDDNSIDSIDSIDNTVIAYPLNILFVDDLFDTGRTIDAVYRQFTNMYKYFGTANLSVATIFWKPEKNLTDKTPDYYLETTKNWIVFEHEVSDMSADEVAKWSPVVAELDEQYA